MAREIERLREAGQQMYEALRRSAAHSEESDEAIIRWAKLTGQDPDLWWRDV